MLPNLPARVRQLTLADDDRIIVITGGRASGKTTIARYLATKHNLAYWSADACFRQLLTKVSIQQFLLKHDINDREQLKQKFITDNSFKKIWLRKVWQYVRINRRQFISKQLYQGKRVILELPLFFENKPKITTDKVIFIHCNTKTMADRWFTRAGNTNQQELRKLLSLQLNHFIKRKLSDITIINSTDWHSKGK